MTGISADPYWWQAAPPQDFHIDHWPERADVVIIGGGYTGFGAAIPLARAGLDVVILERDQIGSGASTRNGGITSGNLRLSFDDLTKRFGAEKATAFYQEAKAARADLAQFITSEKIDCDLQQCGRLVGALRSESLDSMKRDAERLTKLLDIDATVYDRTSLPDYIDTSRYCGGMMRDDIGGIHPAKLLAGMCQIARATSVKIATQTKMIAVSQQSTSSPTPEFRVETSRGIIHAGHVISATNAYTDDRPAMAAPPPRSSNFRNDRHRRAWRKHGSKLDARIKYVWRSPAAWTLLPTIARWKTHLAGRAPHEF